MLNGIGVSGRIGTGYACVVGARESSRVPADRQNTEEERLRLRRAVESFSERSSLLAKSLESPAGTSQADILRGQIAMICDPMVLSQMDQRILTGDSAVQACQAVLEQYENLFEGVEDELTRQRAADIRDIKSRMLQILWGGESSEVALSEIPPDTILVVDELMPSMLALVRKENLKGIAAEKGSMTAHAAILARAMEIPAVFGVDNLFHTVVSGMELIVDGKEGLVITRPSAEETDRYRQYCNETAKEKARLESFRSRESRTGDGKVCQVVCNISSPEEAEIATASGSEGIGLFRTEFLFTGRIAMPGEEEQYQAYRKTAECFAGKEVILRTLDVGGDKHAPCLAMEAEPNPFLGFRAVRYCLENEAVYETQLRAILRASALGNIKIMIPLVTRVEEVRSVRCLLKKIMDECSHNGVSYNRNIQIGIMVETPAACQIADLLAKECDFFSIGTNDLIQYTMAADRGNPRVARLNSPYHPAVLRSICHIIACGEKAGIPVGMCGEAAAELHIIPLLLAFGLKKFSVNPASVLAVRAEISKWTMWEAETVTAEAMALSTAAEIEHYLKSIKR
ncbi:MAG: phosphoenolpyruvate--protein phosphotransferase [Firmicutes bacterium]|nr:phosphoenolpyruvate--protein phosphotransferase [Bacillota bacterium]